MAALFTGLEELKADLRALPAALTGEASAIVLDAANGAATAIRAAYPNRTGDLRDHVNVTPLPTGAFGAGAKVTNGSKLAYIFERGTQARHTKLGANRGSMPPGHVFIPRVIQARRAMYVKLKALLVAHGFTVTGDAG